MNKNILIILSILEVLLIILIVVSCGIYNNEHYKQYYKYIDLDNNEGIATHCQFSDNNPHTFSGGQGSPICELNDGTIVAVKQYTFIKEEIEK